MKAFLSAALLIACFATMAQRAYVYGVVVDSATKDPMIGAHIQNIIGGTLTSTNAEGKFKLPAQIGDTLVITSVGHTTLAWAADSGWFQGEEVEFYLPVNTIYLDEVVVGEFPEYIRFKEKILNTQPEDTTFEIFGVPRVVMDPYPQPEKSEFLNPVNVFFHPISAVHHSFSKREKEKRKIQQLRKTEFTRQQARSKFTREWVAENTQLEGDKLTSFIAYCNFSEVYLAQSSRFAIYELMMDLLPKFLEEYSEKS